jgi:hypothetical protein
MAAGAASIDCASQALVPAAERSTGTMVGRTSRQAWFVDLDLHRK